MNSPIAAMQAAVAIVLTSPHPTSKVAAALFDETELVARTNHWPERIAQKLGSEQRIGNSSGTVHAEVQCLLDFPHPTAGASLCVTDPFCPNCAKNIAEAGIKKVYIDHKGFDKDFARRRGDEFESMSLRIAARAGISIYEVRRKEGTILPLQESPPGYQAPEDNPIKIVAAEEINLPHLVAGVKVIAPRWACGYARSRDGSLCALVASAHAAIGYSEQNQSDRDQISHPEGKYNFYLEPLNRLMMGAARRGLALIDGALYMSCVPTAREQVNLVAAGLTRLTLGTPTTSRDPDGLDASTLLQNAGILRFESL